MSTKFEGDLEETKQMFEQAKNFIVKANTQPIRAEQEARNYMNALFQLVDNYVKPGGEAPEGYARRNDYRNSFVGDTGGIQANSSELDEQGNADLYGPVRFIAINAKKMSSDEFIELAERIRQNYSEYDIEKPRILIAKESVAPKNNLTDEEKKAIADNSKNPDEYVKQMYIEPRRIAMQRMALNGDQVARDLFATNIGSEKEARNFYATDTSTKTAKENVNKSLDDVLRENINKFEKENKPKIEAKLKAEYNELKGIKTEKDGSKKQSTLSRFGNLFKRESKETKEETRRPIISAPIAGTLKHEKPSEQHNPTKANTIERTPQQSQVPVKSTIHTQHMTAEQAKEKMATMEPNPFERKPQNSESKPVISNPTLIKPEQPKAQNNTPPPIPPRSNPNTQQNQATQPTPQQTVVPTPMRPAPPIPTQAPITVKPTPPPVPPKPSRQSPEEQASKAAASKLSDVTGAKEAKPEQAAGTSNAIKDRIAELNKQRNGGVIQSSGGGRGHAG